jgi:RNA polymerase sigma-70 factor (ECF subfamily)
MGIDENQLRLCILDKNGDPQDKFKGLWERYFPRLLIYIASFKGIAPSEYNDIVSEVLLAIFKKIERYNPDYALSTWVYAIARNHFIDRLRKLKNSNDVPLDSAAEQYAAGHIEQKNVVDAIIEQDMVDTCQGIIKKFKKQDQRLIFLKYYEGLNSREIARVEGIPASTVRQRLMMIRSCIKEHIGDCYAD